MVMACSLRQYDSNIGNEPEGTGQTMDETLHSVFEKSQFAVFGVNARGKIGYWNHQCAELFQLPQNISLFGKHSADLICGGDARCTGHCCNECAINQNFESEKQIYDYPMNIQRSDGEEMRVNIATCYVYQEDPSEVSTFFSIRLQD